MTVGTVDRQLRDRAARVLPGGMYGHQNAKLLSPDHPQFFARGSGARVWDADGTEYVDLMCSWGPIVLGHQHEGVQRAVRAQMEKAECLNGPTDVLVELSELLVDTVAHARWALFAKNGTDATTTAVTIARAATGRDKILVAKGAYHGSAPWCTPGPAGVTAEDRVNVVKFEYNDLDSVRAAVAEAGAGNVAAIVVCPLRHDTFRDQELVEPAFAIGLRAICDTIGAALVLDEVRAGLRLDLAGSWESHGVRPDLSAWSKAIANGHALACVLGTDALREAASSIYVTGSFWMAATSMAAAVATISAIRDDDGIASMHRAGSRLRDGLEAQAKSHGFDVRCSGPAQLPFLTFAGDTDFALAREWAAGCARNGVYLHPTHNWFIGAAHTDADIDRALDGTDAAFAALAGADRAA